MSSTGLTYKDAGVDIASGDDAMGVGLNFIFLTATAILSVLFLSVVLVLKHRRASRVA